MSESRPFFLTYFSAITVTCEGIKDVWVQLIEVLLSQDSYSDLFTNFPSKVNPCYPGWGDRKNRKPKEFLKCVWCGFSAGSQFPANSWHSCYFQRAQAVISDLWTDYSNRKKLIIIIIITIIIIIIIITNNDNNNNNNN